MSEAETVPKGAIPYNGIDRGWGGQENIMRLRWESRELIEQLWRSLAYADVKRYNGQPYLVCDTTSGAKPLINLQGARAIINHIESVANPIGNLTKIHQEQAAIMTAHAWEVIEEMLIIEGEEFGCTERHRQLNVLNIVTRLLFLQLMRPVEGHEAAQTRLNYVEQKRDDTIKSQNSGGGWNPFSRSDK